MSPETPKDKQQIMAAFTKLLAARQQVESRVATKEEEAEKSKNQELVASASAYTIDAIVNGMAALQLDFGSTIIQLSERLTSESGKLDELKRSIGIENQRLGEVQQIRLVADALHILTQEHQEKLTTLENQATTQTEALEKEIAQNRKQWQKEQEEFAVAVAEAAELLTKARAAEAADYQYEIQRIRQLETDNYEAEKRQQERELQSLSAEKDKNWAEREKFLTDNQAEFAENQKKVAGFEDELKQAYIKAKEEAIKDADREAKVKSDLIEKEWEATKQGYDMKVQSLEATITRNNEQIAAITAQLQAAMQQAQQLAMRAFQNSADGSSSK